MHNGRNIGDVLQELKDELREFAVTRYQMLVSEMKEKLGAWKAGLPLMGIAAVLAIAAFMVFSFGLVALIAASVDNQYKWAIGAGAIFLLYLIIGSLAGWMGYKEVQKAGMAPTRTMRVLKQDQAWIQSQEMRSA
jgi:uncharacterized membrane protein YqjE